MNLIKNTAQLLEQLFGVHTTHRESDVGLTIGVTASRLIPGNPKRVGLIVVNNSLNTVRLSTNSQMTLTHGVYLSPGGGSMTLIWDRDFNLVVEDWYAIASVAATAIYFLEILITGSTE